MANFCDNTLQVCSSNSENITYIKKFDSENIQVCFDSKWDFPENDMEELYQGLPDKEDINMVCLSVEWGNFYCCFHVCTKDGWEVIQ